MKFDNNTNIFELEFVSNPAIIQPTEIYLNENLHYPQGFYTAIDPKGSVKVMQTEANRLQVITSVNEEIDIKIVIFPK